MSDQSPAHVTSASRSLDDRLTPWGLSLDDPRVLGEVLHERESVSKGAARYRASLEKITERGQVRPTDLADTEPGQRIAEAAVARVVPAVEALQQQAVAGLAGTLMGQPARWWPLALCLGPDKLAYLTVRAILTVGDATAARPLRGAALEIAGHARAEREWELWCESENRLSKDAADAGSARLNWARLARSLNPAMTERAFRRWARHSDTMVRLEWPQMDRLHLGVVMIEAAVTACPDLFAVTLVRIPRRNAYATERAVVLTDNARAWLDARHGENELARPWLMPMIAPPRDWRRLEVQQLPILE